MFNILGRTFKEQITSDVELEKKGSLWGRWEFLYDFSFKPHPISDNLQKLNKKPTEDDFLSALSQPVIDCIQHFLENAIYNATDGGNFNIQDAKWFIKNCVDQLTDKNIMKAHQKYEEN